MRRRTKWKRGVPRGYRHSWIYSSGPWKETKTGPGRWTFTFTSTKGRTHRAKYHPRAPPRGTRIVWKINAIQTAYKTDANHYVTKMKGTKRLVKIRR